MVICVVFHSLSCPRLFTEVTCTRQALKYDKTLSRLPRPTSPSPIDKQQQTSYAKTALQLLDLLDTLYLRTGNVFKVTSDLGASGGGDGVSMMWHMCWCPLLEVRTVIYNERLYIYAYSYTCMCMQVVYMYIYNLQWHL